MLNEETSSRQSVDLLGRTVGCNVVVHRARTDRFFYLTISFSISLFFYLTMRLGLRTGELHGIERRQIRREPAQLVVDQAVPRGTKQREAKLVSRKNDESYELNLTPDNLAAIDWPIRAGYAGREFLFSKPGAFPRYIDSHARPLQLAQRKLGLLLLSSRVLAASDPNAAGFYRRMGASEIGVVPASMPGAPDRVLPVFAFVADEAPAKERSACAGDSVDSIAQQKVRTTRLPACRGHPSRRGATDPRDSVAIRPTES